MNKTIEKRISRLLVFFLIVLLSVGILSLNVYADPLDEIVDYEIDAVVNDDATVNLTYHVEWKVLDSDSEGPLSWVRVGIPNSHYSNVKPLTDTIKSIGYDSGSGSYMRIDFDREYYEDEIVTFEFSLDQDNMYQVDRLEEGYTGYIFTPGWFDGIVVDHMAVRWRADKAESWEPPCFTEEGKLSWEYENLSPGEKITLSVTYPNDAYGFDLSKKIEEGEEESSDDYEWILGLVFVAIPLGIFQIIKKAASAVYEAGASFGSPDKKITRTKIVYFDTCPGCGAVRKEGQEKCEYCGRSLIKSEEIIEEKELKSSEKEAAKFNKDGEYRYSDSPNTYVRVHVVPIPRPVRSHSSSRGSGYHSSCVHSSCACACACACAGGGRAGCSAKDFMVSIRRRFPDRV